MDWSFLDGITTEMILGWTWKFVGALLIFVIGRWVVRAISGGTGKTMLKRGLDVMLVSFLTAVINIVLLTAVIISSVSFLGIPIAPLVAVLGGAALAVGLALQGSLSNLASGVMLVLFHPFRVGHYVDAGGTSGTVTAVKLFQTELTTPDNKQVVIPNAQITSNVITNYSEHETRRIDLVIGVSYDDDLKVARDTIMDVLQKHDKLLKEPEPVVMPLDLADSSVNLAVRPWVNTADYWPVRGELLEQIKVALEDAGCSIPYPQRDVHHFNVAANDSAVSGGD